MKIAFLIMSMYLACIPEILLSGKWKYPYFKKGFPIYLGKIALESPNELLPGQEYLSLKFSDKFGKPETEFKKYSDNEILFRDRLLDWHIRISVACYRGFIHLDRENKTIYIKGFLNWFILIYAITFGVFFYGSFIYWSIVMLVVYGIISRISRVRKELADFY